MLDVIRRFRPQIIVSIFSGTPRDGHGQHQVAGILARVAYDALRDSTWGPVKFYRSAFFDTAATTLTIPTGAARSGPRTIVLPDRDGRAQPPPLPGHGPAAASRVRLRPACRSLESKVGTTGGIFDGVDTVWHGRERFRALIDSARARLNPYAPDVLVPYLARASAALGPEDTEQRAILDGAIANAAGLVVDGTADDAVVIPGERVQVEVAVWNAGAAPVPVDGVDIQAPDGMAGRAHRSRDRHGRPEHRVWCAASP